MKTKASTFLKQMLSTILAVVKAKSTAVRAKTSAMKTRLLIFGILRNKKLLVSAINHRIHAIMGQDGKKDDDHHRGDVHDGDDGSSAAAAGDDDDDGSKKAVVLYSTAASFFRRRRAEEEAEDDSDDYLTHSLFDEDEDDDELVNAPGSVIDVVRDAKEGEGGEFRLEDEIDHVADVFIRRIHKQFKLQKLESFKRFCEMMERSA